MRRAACGAAKPSFGRAVGILRVKADLDALQERLGFRYDDADLLRLALRHSSWCAENGDVESNERLEFLGDAVVELTIRQELYERLPGRPEGELSKIRRSVVNTYALSRAASRSGLGDALMLGRGEEQSGGRTKPSLLCNTLEALVGAAFLDGGWQRARQLVLHLVDHELDKALAAGPDNDDPKTRLQELVARFGLEPIEYSVTGEGPDHERWFFSDARWITPDGTVLSASGEGQSKKMAEQNAASALLDVIESQPELPVTARTRSNKKNGAGHA